jgi:hypothetical protein
MASRPPGGGCCKAGTCGCSADVWSLNGLADAGPRSRPGGCGCGVAAVQLPTGARAPGCVRARKRDAHA